MNKSLKIFSLCMAFLYASVVVQNVFASGYESEGVPNLAEQREIRLISMTHQYDLNPHTASYTSEAQVLSGLYEGLFSYDPVTLEPRNALCVSYKISRTKKRWTFTLREGACFSTGEPITASTVRDSWLALLATPNAPYSSLLDCIEGARNFRTGKGVKEDVGISVRNDKTLVVHLEEPAEHLPRILCHHAFSIVSSKPNSFSGAFTLKSYKNNTIVLAKNPKYYDAASVIIPGITITLSDDLEENSYQFNTGNADWITEGNALAVKIINSDAIHIAAEFGTYYLFFKINNAPWDNADFRTALLEAIPYDSLRKNLTMPATTLVYPLPDYPAVPGIDDYDTDDEFDEPEPNNHPQIQGTARIEIVGGEALQNLIENLGMNDLFNKILSSANLHKNAKAPTGSNNDESDPKFSKVRVFVFDDLESVGKACRILVNVFDGKSWLYKNPDDGKFYLKLVRTDDDKKDFLKICNLMIEYASHLKFTDAAIAYMEEHYKCLVAEHAVSSMCQF